MSAPVPRCGRGGRLAVSKLISWAILVAAAVFMVLRYLLGHSQFESMIVYYVVLMILTAVILIAALIYFLKRRAKEK